MTFPAERLRTCSATTLLPCRLQAAIGVTVTGSAGISVVMTEGSFSDTGLIPGTGSTVRNGPYMFWAA